jgi:hypothetical protein
VKSFQLTGLAAEPFAPLFALSDAELAARSALRVVAADNTSYPCRVSLADAQAGEELLLLPFEHQPAESPYKASGPIFVRKAARRCVMEPGVIPGYVSGRLISVRAYDLRHRMTEATVCGGAHVAAVIMRMFEDTAAEYIHLHNAARGCFSCAVNRI